MSNSALASLTAQYTDSENEDEDNDSQNSQVIIPHKVTSAESPIPKQLEAISKAPKSKKKKHKKVRRLVSYQDDTLISDDEDDNAEISTENSEDDSDYDEDGDGAVGNKVKENGSPMNVNDDESSESLKDFRTAESIEKSGKYAHYKFTLPAEPKGKASQELVDKIKHLYDKMDQSNMDMNRFIQERKEFRNPSIYEKLIQYCDINEFGTNYPPEIYDPLQWGAESYYEELARVQKNEMLKRQKERKDTDKIEQATALARKVEEEAKKRKSKWDQPAPAAKPAIAQALTTTVTGTKGTVISAFGSLPKKPTA